MAHRNKRARLGSSPRPTLRYANRDAQTLEKSSDFKRARVREFIEKGLTKDDMDEHRHRYFCMKDHPGHYCSDCNPRFEDGYNEDDVDDDKSEDYFDEADLSDSWSDKAAENCPDNISDFASDYGDHYDEDAYSVTYSRAWKEEKEKFDTIKYQQKDRFETIKHLKERVAFVGAVAARLEKTSSTDEKPVGELHGGWDLYNTEVCPQNTDPTDEYYNFYMSKLATSGSIPSEFMGNFDVMPLESYIQLQVKHYTGGVMPFDLPKNRSLSPIPIKISRDSYRKGSLLDGEIIFLGEDCMRLRVPRALFEKNDGGIEEGTEMVEFAGIKQEQRSKLKW